MSAAIKQAAQAVIAVREAQAAVTAERVKLGTLQSDWHAATAERDEIIQFENEDAALRIVDGEAAAPIQPERTERLHLLMSDRIPALTAGIPLQERRIKEAEDRAAAAQQPLTDAVVAIVNDIQPQAVDAIRKALSPMAPECARLMAGDIVRERFAGRKMTLAPGQTPPFSGAIAVAKLVKSLPERFRPESLQEANLSAEAEKIAADIIQQIQGVV